MASIIDKRIFDKELNEQDGCWYLVIDSSIPVAQRRQLTRNVATILQEPRLLTFAELKLPSGRRHPALVEFTEEWLNQHGLLDEFDYLQQIIVEDTYEPLLDKIYVGKKNKAYQYGVAFQPDEGPGRAQLSPTARRADKIKGSKISCKLYALVSKVATIGVPELATAARRQDNLKHVSLVPGPKSNSIFTNQQTNFALPGINLADEISKFGDPHPDSEDHETSMTFMLNCSNLDDEDHGGRLVVPALKATIPLKPRSIICFSATFLHFAFLILEYSVPEDSPLRLPLTDLPSPLQDNDDGPYSHTRCTIPVYTEKKMRYPKFGQFNLEIFTQKAALALFDDIEGHQNWMVNYFIVFEDKIKSHINIDYSASAENLFGVGPKLLMAADGTYIAAEYKRLSDEKEADQTGKFSEKAKIYARAKAENTQKAAVLARKKAMVNIVASPASSAQKIEPKDHVFADPEFYANLFGWIDENEEKQEPSIDLIKEIKDAIISPNPDFDQLRADMEALSCGTKFRTKKGKSLAIWVEYKTDWECTEEGISCNPDWTKESMGGVALEDMSQEAIDVFSARKVNAIRE